MLFPFSSLLCLWLCCEAAGSQLHWQKTKTSHYESAAALRNAQSRRWRTVSGEHDAGTHAVSAQASWLDTVNRSPSELPRTQIPRAAVRNSGAQHGQHVRAVSQDDALRTDARTVGAPQGRACSHGEVPKQTEHGPICTPGPTRHNRQRSAKPGRTKRSESPQSGGAWEALPAAMAQEQEDRAPFGLNVSDYDDYSLPNNPDTTPGFPLSTRPRRRLMRNPFYPLTTESCGAYAVLITAALLFSVGIIGNVSVMCIVCHNYYMRSISNSLLANLALWDFVVIFFCLPLVVFHELTKNWLLGEFSCRIVPYLEVSCSASPGAAERSVCCHNCWSLYRKEGKTDSGESLLSLA